ncbi:MAG: DUF6268 family outer membrane beta-barrel protein [Gilvibacter sp.]
MRCILALCALLFSLSSHAQDYVDILNVSYSEGFNADYRGFTGHTNVRSFDAQFTYPVVLNKDNALITGADYSVTSLTFKNADRQSNLHSTTLKIGWAKVWNERWSSTVVFLPKVASDYNEIDREDFYFGGFGVLKYQKKENLLYRFGLYASTEAFGVIATPIIGLYYTSPNDLLEIDLSLPISANVNYIIAKNLKLGADYVGLGRSYSVTINDLNTTYVQQNSLDFSAYLEKAFIEQSLLLRLKLGYSTNDYERYFLGDKIDLALSAFRFGDDRIKINEHISSAPFLKIEAIYRFYIESDSAE